MKKKLAAISSVSPAGVPASAEPSGEKLKGGADMPPLPPSGGSWTVMPDGTLKRTGGTEFAEPSNAAETVVEAPLKKD